jgi:toxin ParE1/3/4
MNDHFIAPAAVQDLEAIAIWTVEHFGERQLLRYKALISQAIQDVVAKPFRAGSHSRSDVAPDLRSYHLSLSKTRVKGVPGRVKSPRHFLLYFALRRGGS